MVSSDRTNTSSEYVSRKGSCDSNTISKQDALDTLTGIQTDEAKRTGSYLSAFNDEILCFLWPAESVVAGQLVCKKLASALQGVPKVKWHVNPRSIQRLYDQSPGNSRAIVEKMTKSMCRFRNAEIDFHFEDYQQVFCWDGPADGDEGQPAPSVQAKIAVKALQKAASLGQRIVGVSFCGVPEELLRELHSLGRRPGDKSTLQLRRVDLSLAGRMCKHATRSLKILKCASLTDVKLSAVHFWPGPLRTLGKALAQCPALQSLNMSDSALPPAWKFPSSSQSFWKSVTGLPALTHLNLSNVAFNGHEEVLAQHLANLQSLQHFSFSRTDCKPADLQDLISSIAHHRKLSHVDLSGSFISEQGSQALAAAVAQWPELRSLALADCELAGSSATLETLVASLARSCPSLARLDLSCASRRGAGAALPARMLAQQLQHWPKLSALDVRGRLELEGAAEAAEFGARVGGCAELRSLKASHAMPRLALHCAGLTCLELEGRRLAPAAAAALAAELPGLHRLKALVLRGAEAGSGGVLARALGELPALSHLDLSGCALGAEGAEELARGLAGCGQLATLVLAEAGLGDHGAAALARALPSLPRLTSLCLRRNALHAPGVLALCDALPSAIAHLDLSHNFPGAAGFRRLAQVLPRCSALVSALVRDRKSVV